VEKKTVIINVQTEDGVLEDQLYEMAKRGEQGTDEFKTLAAEAGRLKKTIAQVDMEVDALSMTTANKLGGALGGAASGFELVQGAMGAMGAESEAVEAALLKVQSAMAIAQGVQGVKEAIPAFKSMAAAVTATAAGQRALAVSAGLAAGAMKVLNFVMSMNPIMLIVGGITALIGAFAFFTRDTGNAKKAAEDYTKALEQQRAAIDKNFSTLQKRQQERLELMKSQGATEKELFDQQIANTKKLAEEKAEAHKKEKYSYQNLRLLYKQLMDQGEEEEAAKIREQLKSSRDRYNELKQQSKDYYHQLYVDNQIFVAENAKKVAENAKKVAENAEQVREQQAADRKAAEQKRKEDEANAAKEREDAWQAEKERSQEMIDAGNAMSEIASTRREEDIQEIKTAEQTKYDIITYYQNELLKKQEAAAANEKAIKERNKSFIIENAEETFQFISDLATIFEGKSEASQKRAFKIRKAAAIAQTTVETFKAAQTAYASQIVPLDPTSPVRGAIAAAFAVASGLAKVKAIASTKFEGGGATGGATGGGGGGGSAPAASTPAQFNIVGNSGTNQIAEGLANQTVKAFVTEGDVSSAQQLQRNKITTISL
jgi:hypothetical protein